MARRGILCFVGCLSTSVQDAPAYGRCSCLGPASTVYAESRSSVFSARLVPPWVFLLGHDVEDVWRLQHNSLPRTTREKRSVIMILSEEPGISRSTLRPDHWEAQVVVEGKGLSMESGLAPSLSWLSSWTRSVRNAPSRRGLPPLRCVRLLSVVRIYARTAFRAMSYA